MRSARARVALLPCCAPQGGSALCQVGLSPAIRVPVMCHEAEVARLACLEIMRDHARSCEIMPRDHARCHSVRERSPMLVSPPKRSLWSFSKLPGPIHSCCVPDLVPPWPSVR